MKLGFQSLDFNTLRLQLCRSEPEGKPAWQRRRGNRGEAGWFGPRARVWL